MPDEKPQWLLQMEGILEALNEGVLILDDCHRILFVNERFLQMTGRPREHIEARTPAHFYSGEDLAYLMGQIERGDEEGRARFEFFLLDAANERLPVVTSSRTIEDPDGGRFAIVTFTDIREQKRAEQRLREANEVLERHAKEMEAELELAARVQQSLVPQGLRWGRVAVETYYMPVRTIGGDLGLVTPLGETQLNLLVCDVSGHGISSALVANRIYSEITSLVERRVELGELLRRLNRFVLQKIRLSGFFFTLAVARLEEGGRKLTFAGGGHPPAMWISPRGECRLLESQSTILGALENAVPKDPAQQVELVPGDRLVLYTDGLTEVFNLRGEMLGIEGLQEIVLAAAGKPLPEMKQAVLDQVAAWRHGPHTDDTSLVLVEVQ